MDFEWTLFSRCRPTQLELDRDRAAGRDPDSSHRRFHPRDLGADADFATRGHIVEHERRRALDAPAVDGDPSARRDR